MVRHSLSIVVLFAESVSSAPGVSGPEAVRVALCIEHVEEAVSGAPVQHRGPLCPSPSGGKQRPGLPPLLPLGVLAHHHPYPLVLGRLQDPGGLERKHLRIMGHASPADEDAAGGWVGGCVGWWEGGMCGWMEGGREGECEGWMEG